MQPPGPAPTSGGSASAPAAPGWYAKTMSVKTAPANKGKGKGRAANVTPTPAATSARTPQSVTTNGGAGPAKSRPKGIGKGSKPKRGYLATDVFDRLTSPTRLSSPAAIYKRPDPRRPQPSYATERPAERPHPFIKSKPKKKTKTVDSYSVPKVINRPHPFLSAPKAKASVFDRLSSPANGGAGRPAAAVYSNLSPEPAASRGGRSPTRSPQATYGQGFAPPSATGTSTDAREHLKAMKAAATGRPSPSAANAGTGAGTPSAATPQAGRKKKKKKADPYDVLKPARRPHPLLDTDSPYRATRRGQLVLKAPSLSPPKAVALPDAQERSEAHNWAVHEKGQKRAALDKAAYDERSHTWAERQALLRKSPIPVTRPGAAEAGSSDDSSGSGDSDADDVVGFESEAEIEALHVKLRDAIDRYHDGEPAHADANEGLHAMATDMPSKLLSYAPADKSWPNPLIYAVAQRKVGATMALLESGAKPTAPGGRTLLHLAVDTPEPSMKLLDALLEFGQDVNAKDTAQNTPLLLAVAAGASETQLAAQQLLLESGADPLATNAQGQSVTMLASPDLLDDLRLIMGDSFDESAAGAASPSAGEDIGSLIDPIAAFDAELDGDSELDDDNILPLPPSMQGDGDGNSPEDNGYPPPPPLLRRPSRGGSDHIYEFDEDPPQAVANEKKLSFMDSIAAFGAELDDDDDDVYEAVGARLGTASQPDDTYEVPMAAIDYDPIEYEDINGPTKPVYEPMDEDEATYVWALDFVVAPIFLPMHSVGGAL